MSSVRLDTPTTFANASPPVGCAVYARVAPAVVDPLLDKSDVAVNLVSVLRRVMPLDWREQGGCLRGRDLAPLDLSDPNDHPALWAEQREVMLEVQSLRPIRTGVLRRREAI